MTSSATVSPDIAAVAVGLGLGLVFFPLDLVRGLGCVVFHGNLLLLGQFAGHLLKLFDAGKLVDVFQAEAEEEILGRLVEDGAADDLFAAGGGDELARHQAAEDAAGVDAADLGDLGRGDGLLVGDDGEGLEGLEGELQGRLQRFDEAADGVVVLGLGGEAVAAGDLADLEAAVGGGVVGDELVEDGAEVVAEAALLFLGLAGDLLFVFFFGRVLRRGLRFPALLWPDVTPKIGHVTVRPSRRSSWRRLPQRCAGGPPWRGAASSAAASCR